MASHGERMNSEIQNYSMRIRLCHHLIILHAEIVLPSELTKQIHSLCTDTDKVVNQSSILHTSNHWLSFSQDEWRSSLPKRYEQYIDGNGTAVAGSLEL